MLSRIGRHAFIGALLSLVLLLGALRTVSAHEIPNDVTIQAYLKPEGSQLHLLVRVPLIALRDMTWPMKPGTDDTLDLAHADSELTNAATLWIGDEAHLYEGAQALPTPRVAALRATPPADRSFESYEQALALVTGPRASDADDITIKEGFLDVLFDYPITSDRSRFSLNTQWARLGIHAVTIIRLLLPDGAVRAFELQGDPGFVRLDPSWYQAAGQFVRLGFDHILDGTDHLLFLLCLVIPFRRVRQLVVVITAFTLAHSVTLLASAYGMAPDALWFPPLIETLIACSIVYMALENIVGATVHRRWFITFCFGLVHGFGFSFPLRQTLQFAGGHMLTSLLAFNIGIELGQLLVLVLLVPALDLLFRVVMPERIGVTILSAIVAHTGWHWMAARAALLWQYQFAWPQLTPSFLAAVVRWLMLLVILGGLAWVIKTLTNALDDAGEVKSRV
jgi:hypothetical protein